MSVATLTIPTPESCRACDLCRDYYDYDYPEYEEYKCYKGFDVKPYTASRHPDCPLRIEYTCKCGKTTTCESGVCMDCSPY